MARPSLDDPAVVAKVIQRKATDAIGLLSFGGITLRCALGSAGSRAVKREGDGATPAGLWRLDRLLYRPDRLRVPRTSLPARPLKVNDGWCDAAGNRNYNRPVRLPYGASAETLWRDDGLYDIIVVLAVNTMPRVQGLGSAIFMHVARPDYAPTAGCIALARPDLLRLLALPKPPGYVRVGPAAG